MRHRCIHGAYSLYSSSSVYARGTYAVTFIIVIAHGLLVHMPRPAQGLGESLAWAGPQVARA